MTCSKRAFSPISTCAVCSGPMRRGGIGSRESSPGFTRSPLMGPVGQLMNALGRHPFRPAHLHYIISADGFDTLTTHIFDPDDPYIHSDAVFGVKQSLMAKFDLIAEPARQAAAVYVRPYCEVADDFVLAPVKASS